MTQSDPITLARHGIGPVGITGDTGDIVEARALADIAAVGLMVQE